MKEIGIDWGVFYRGWREEKGTRNLALVMGRVWPYFYMEFGEMVHTGEIPEQWAVSDEAVEQSAYWATAVHPDDQEEE